VLYGFVENFKVKTALLVARYSSKYLKPKKEEKKEKTEGAKMVAQSINGSQGSEAANEHLQKVVELFYQDLALWVTNAEQLLVYSLHKLCL
jgi:hypothetical protein